ncbi:hypothetical protein DBL01_10715 [Acinetobacter pittii]|nr:hypothetical protein DBL01_10715 [Acinetobacter pittii]
MEKPSATVRGRTKSGKIVSERVLQILRCLNGSSGFVTFPERKVTELAPLIGCKTVRLRRGKSKRIMKYIYVAIPLFFRTIIHKNGVQNDRNKPHTQKR